MIKVEIWFILYNSTLSVNDISGRLILKYPKEMVRHIIRSDKNFQKLALLLFKKLKKAIITGPI